MNNFHQLKIWDVSIKIFLENSLLDLDATNVKRFILQDLFLNDSSFLINNMKDLYTDLVKEPGFEPESGLLCFS